VCERRPDAPHSVVVVGRAENPTYVGTQDDKSKHDVVGAVTVDRDDDPALVVARRILVVMASQGVLDAVNDLADCNLGLYEICALDVSDMEGFAGACQEVRRRIDAGPTLLQAAIDELRLGATPVDVQRFTRIYSAGSQEIRSVLIALEDLARRAQNEGCGLFIDL
jgi:hypothetical protein